MQKPGSSAPLFTASIFILFPKKRENVLASGPSLSASQRGLKQKSSKIGVDYVPLFSALPFSPFPAGEIPPPHFPLPPLGPTKEVGNRVRKKG